VYVTWVRAWTYRIYGNTCPPAKLAIATSQGFYTFQIFELLLKLKKGKDPSERPLESVYVLHKFHVLIGELTTVPIAGSLA
jgi:hypothetical protein